MMAHLVSILLSSVVAQATPPPAPDGPEAGGPVEAEVETPVGVIEADVIYGRVDALALTYDLIKPTAAMNGATVICMVSGGWISRWFDPRMALEPEIRDHTLIHQLLRDGYHVVMLRHGSSPRYKVPDAVDHVQQAIRHLRTSAEARGLDPERIGSFGFSAGGHLSLQLATMGGREAPRALQRERMVADDRVPRDRAPIAAAVAWFPPVDLTRIVGPSNRYPALDFEPERAVEFSPIRRVDENDAPILLMHGSEDDIVPVLASTEMKRVYDENDLVAEFELFEGEGHGFDGDAAIRSSNQAKAWFDRWLLADTPEGGSAETVDSTPEPGEDP